MVSSRLSQKTIGDEFGRFRFAGVRLLGGLTKLGSLSSEELTNMVKEIPTNSVVSFLVKQLLDRRSNNIAYRNRLSVEVVRVFDLMVGSFVIGIDLLQNARLTEAQIAKSSAKVTSFTIFLKILHLSYY